MSKHLQKIKDSLNLEIPFEPSPIKNDFWSYGENELVGHGKQTTPKCGTFKKHMGCLNYKAHNQSRFFSRKPD